MCSYSPRAGTESTCWVVFWRGWCPYYAGMGPWATHPGPPTQSFVYRSPKIPEWIQCLQVCARGLVQSRPCHALIVPLTTQPPVHSHLGCKHDASDSRETKSLWACSQGPSRRLGAPTKNSQGFSGKLCLLCVPLLLRERSPCPFCAGVFPGTCVKNGFML